MIIINSRQNLTGLQSLWFLQISRVYRLFRPDVNGGPGQDLAGLSNVVPVLESEDQYEVLSGLPALVARVARLCCVWKLEVSCRSARGQLEVSQADPTAANLPQLELHLNTRLMSLLSRPASSGGWQRKDTERRGPSLSVE